MPDWKDRILSATCAIRAGDGARPLGTGVLIESDKVLTCRHVITEDGKPDGAERPDLFVSFPDGGIADVVPEQGYAGCDAVVLTLRGQRSPQGTAVLSGSYRAPARVELLGYPAADRTDDGVWRAFAVHGPTASGLVQLDWQDGGSFRGHSGGPVVHADTGRLVGLLREGSEVGRFDRYLPLRRMLDAGVLGRLPWLIEGDDAEGHFTRRSRGRSGVAGKDVFTGRERALERARTWLTSPDPASRVLVVTGRPGTGKSAVIARGAMQVIRLQRSDPRWRGLLFHARNADDAHARRAIADLFGAADDTSEAALLEAADAIAEPDPDRRWVVIVDGLDEAATPQDRKAVASLLVNLARRPWTRVAVATRPMSAAGPFGEDSLLRRFGVTGPDDAHLLDLDTGAYFALEDLAAFTEQLLRQDDQRFPGPDGAAWQTYRADEALRRRLARLVAERADRNFLVASLTAHPLSEAPHALDPTSPGFREDLLPGTVGEALERYLDTRPEGAPTRGVLTALAYAEGSGVDDGTWRLFAAALGYPVGQVVLDELRRSPIADYLLQSTSEVDGHATRLFHQALVDQLRRPRDRRSDQDLIFEALRLRATDGGGWGRAGSYVHARIAVHAAEAGRLGELLTDPAFLLVAHLRRVRRLAEGLELDPKATGYRALLEEVGPRAEALSPSRRAFALSLTASRMGLDAIARELDSASVDRSTLHLDR